MTTRVAAPQRIDIHHHFFPSRNILLDFGLTRSAGKGQLSSLGEASWRPEASLQFMNAMGIDTAVLSSPNWLGQCLSDSAARRFARAVNVEARRAVEDHPGRFGFFGHIPAPTDIDGALEEMRFAFDILGADGITLSNAYQADGQTHTLGDPRFELLWAELDRRGAVVLVDSEDTPTHFRHRQGYPPPPVSEIANRILQCAADLVASGRKRQYPNMKVVLSHSGGSTPLLPSRVAAMNSLERCDLRPEEVAADLRTFYFETALSGFVTNLVALENFVPHERILFGTDFPTVSLDFATSYAKGMDAYFQSRPRVHQQIMHGNAATLLPRLFGKVNSTAARAPSAASA